MIASHDEYPIERMALSHDKRWLGSVSHDECLKLTDVLDLFEDSDEDEEGEEGEEGEEDESLMEGEEEEGDQAGDADGDVAMDDSDEEVVPVERKKRKPGKKGMGNIPGRKSKDTGFFDGL